MKTKSPVVPELYVSDLRASLKFYVDLIGFSIEFDRPEEGFAALELGSSRIMLEQIASFSSSNHEEMRRGRWVPKDLQHPCGRGINFEIEVVDVEEVHQRFQERRYPLAVELHEKPYRVGDEICMVRQFLAADPDGYLVRPSQTLQLELNP